MTENLTKRQEKILNAIIDKYIKTAEPVSSKLLAKKRGFDICPATIRNEMQELADMGYIFQPHTSAGRVPTRKAYHYFVNVIFDGGEKFSSNFIFREIKTTRQQIEEELRLAEDLMKSLEEMASIFSAGPAAEKNNLLEILEKIGPARITYDRNIDIINSLIKELENF